MFDHPNGDIHDPVERDAAAVVRMSDTKHRAEYNRSD
jgi:hypothetical protein